MKIDSKEIIDNNIHNALLKVSEYTREEQKDLAKFFAEGSTTLELALKTLWNKKLYTTACCKSHYLGEQHFYYPYMYSYIAFESGVDVFKYLSDELVSNPYVVLIENVNQIIYFYGENKDMLMIHFINDILKKQENNSKYLEGKVNKNLAYTIRKQVEHEYLINSGFTEEEYNEYEDINNELLILNEESNYTSINEEEYDDLLNRMISIKNQVYQRKKGKKKRGR